MARPGLSKCRLQGMDSQKTLSCLPNDLLYAKGCEMKAFMFDLDGTLLDTLADIAAACNQLLSLHGWPQHPVSVYRHMVGNGFGTLIRRAVPEAVLASLDARTLAQLVEEGRGIYGQHLQGATVPYPGMTEALRALSERGLLLAVLSNKPDEMTQTLIPQQFPDIAFAQIYGGRSDMPLKPDPSGALKLLQNMGISPADCFYVGDSDVDMKTALAAGMIPVGVSWGFRGEDEVRAAGAAHIVRQAADLVRLADGLPLES